MVSPLFFRLPKAQLLPILALIERATNALAGPGPAARAVGDLRFLLSRDDESRAILTRLLTRSRAEEVRSIVRGAVLRSLS